MVPLLDKAAAAHGQQHMARYFIAVSIPQAAKDRLSDVVIPAIAGMRLVGTDEFHLTLHFLGELSPERLSQVRACLDSILCRRFLMTIRGVGSFSLDGHPHVLWAGVESNSDLSRLHQVVGSSLKATVGIEPESRPYLPHITVARLTQPPPPVAMDQYEVQNARLEIPQIPIDEFALYSSQFVDAVPQYSRVATFPLAT